MNCNAAEISGLMSLNAELKAVERAPLAERKENAEEWFKDLHSVGLIRERTSWLLQGCYGHGSYIQAHRIRQSPRMNRAWHIGTLLAALEWRTPARMATAAWKRLTPEEQQTVNAAIISELDSWNEE